MYKKIPYSQLSDCTGSFYYEGDDLKIFAAVRGIFSAGGIFFYSAGIFFSAFICMKYTEKMKKTAVISAAVWILSEIIMMFPTEKITGPIYFAGTFSFGFLSGYIIETAVIVFRKIKRGK